MITFRSYASGSSGNIHTVSDGATTIMLDCGISWKRIREHLQFKTSEISGVILGHRHMDHCKGAKDASTAGLDIYASRETFDALAVLEHHQHVIAAGSQFRIGTWEILPFETVHDCDGSLGFYMRNSEGEAFLYLTDSGYTKVRFKDLRVIACECNFIDELLTQNILNGSLPSVVGHRVRRNHMSLNVFLEMLKANDLSRCSSIWILHLSSGNSDESRMIREIQSAVGIPCRAD